MKRIVLFRKTHELEEKITLFLMNIIESGVLFSQAFNHYIETGETPVFLALREKVSVLESENDGLRREVENQLYAQMLLPDMRSDILHLIEGCDKIINKYESDLVLMAVEKPKIPDVLKKPIMQLVQTNTECVSALISGIKDVLAGVPSSESLPEVHRLEHLVDLQALELKQTIFQKLKEPLARQLQLKEFVYGVEKISDMAEDVADFVSVFAVKHGA